MESIDVSFNYMKWHYLTKNILEDIILLQQDASYIEEEFIIVATICNQKCFVGTNMGLIRGFLLKTKQELFKIPMFNSIFIRTL